MKEERGAARLVPKNLEPAITTPHEHEHPEHNRPLWLIWVVEKSLRTDVPYFPRLDTVCDTEDSCRYHIGAILEINPESKDVFVERIPANHRFGSSLPELQMKSHMAIWRAREKNEGYL